LPTGAALKGYGFSRAETWREKQISFSRRRMLLGCKPIAQGLKGEEIHQDLLTARLKPCPFKTESSRNLKCVCPVIQGIFY
jgi:hypothetical protein